MSEQDKNPIWISHPGDGRDTRLCRVSSCVHRASGLEKAVLRLSATDCMKPNSTARL
jgi:hypothetical protein